MPVPGPELLSMAQQFTGLPMNDLIGGPLTAAAKANADMAVTQTKFILDTCFTKSTATGSTEVTYKPIMIAMSIERPYVSPTTTVDSTGKTVSAAPTVTMMVTKFNLPLLTIIPLSSLGVDDVTIDFEMEVSSSFSEDTSKEAKEKIAASADIETKFGWGAFSVSIKAHASYDKEDSSSYKTHYEKKNSAKYTVHVHAGQLPMPKGVNTIIEAFTKAIEPITAPAETTPPKP